MAKGKNSTRLILFRYSKSTTILEAGDNNGDEHDDDHDHDDNHDDGDELW